LKKTAKSFNSTLRMGSCELKRSPIKQVSDKKAIKNRQETKLSLAMKEKCGFKCQFCGADYSNAKGNLGKHEIVFRSLGGDALSEKNCIILCWINFTSNPFTLGCHQLAQKGLITKEQLYRAKKQNDC